jgi:hypothetical protein
MVVWLTRCDLSVFLDETQITPLQRTAVLVSSDGTIVQRSPLATALSGDVAQSVTFTQLPTFGKAYSLSIESSAGTIGVFQDMTILQLLTSIEDARRNLVDVEPDPNKRQAALENESTGAVNV